MSAAPNPFSAAVAALRRAGYQVTPAEGLPIGLTDVEGLGRDLTIAQVLDAASKKGSWA